MSLTPDCIGQLCNSLPSELNGFSPTLQILKVVHVRNKLDNTRDRYRVIISDGVHYCQGMIATQHNHLVDSGVLRDNVLVKVSDFMKKDIQNRPLIILLKFETVDGSMDKIGSPMDIGMMGNLKSLGNGGSLRGGNGGVANGGSGKDQTQQRRKLNMKHKFLKSNDDTTRLVKRRIMKNQQQEQQQQQQHIITIPKTEERIDKEWLRQCRCKSIVFELPSLITSIENSAFSHFGSLETINIPPSVTVIGESAFYFCKSLTTVNLPSSLTTIRKKAFYYCTSLATPINIPPSVTTIEQGAFNGCSSLTTVNLPPSLTIVEDSVFDVCTSLTTVNLPSSLVTIGDYAFRFCRSLIVSIPSSVTTIGTQAFRECTSLTTITIPSSVTTIDYGAFDGCSSLTTINIPPLVTEISDTAFCRCRSLTSINIPSSVTKIGSMTFSHCSSLTSINIPSSVTTIRNSFSGCSSLTSIEIPPSVTSLGGMAFEDCSSLTTINLPLSINWIGDKTFRGCSSLRAVSIPLSVTDIGNAAFEGCSSLVSVIIPPSVTTVQPYAFQGCSSLINITLPSSIAPHEEEEWGEDMDEWELEQRIENYRYTGYDNRAFEDCQMLKVATRNSWFYESTTIFLKDRFKNLPFHQVCYYNSDLILASSSNIDDLFQQQQQLQISTNEQRDLISATDALHMNALHVLVCHPHATASLMRKIVALDEDWMIRGARTVHGFRPIDLFLVCRGMKNMTDLQQQQQQQQEEQKEEEEGQQQLSISDILRLGGSWNDIECMAVLEGQRLDNYESDEGLCPFMVAGIEERCGLDVVYNLAKMNLNAFTGKANRIEL